MRNPKNTGPEPYMKLCTLARGTHTSLELLTTHALHSLRNISRVGLVPLLCMVCHDALSFAALSSSARRKPRNPASKFALLSSLPPKDLTVGNMFIIVCRAKRDAFWSHIDTHDDRRSYRKCCIF